MFQKPLLHLVKDEKPVAMGAGLDGCEQFMDVNDMIRDEDLLSHRAMISGGEALTRDYFSQPEAVKQEVQELMANMIPGGPLSRTLSARERNMLKRKAKVVVKDGVKEWGEEEEVEEPSSKRPKPVKSVITEQPGENKVLLSQYLFDIQTLA